MAQKRLLAKVYTGFTVPGLMKNYQRDAEALLAQGYEVTSETDNQFLHIGWQKSVTYQLRTPSKVYDPDALPKALRMPATYRGGHPKHGQVESGKLGIGGETKGGGVSFVWGSRWKSNELWMPFVDIERVSNSGSLVKVTIQTSAGRHSVVFDVLADAPSGDGTSNAVACVRRIETQLTTPSAESPRVPPPSQRNQARSVPDLIREVAALRDAGVLTTAEFEAKKAELLRRL